MPEQASLFAPADDVSGAVFDSRRRYRYLLWRRWDQGAPVLWIMLNPSTADESVLDPTLRRCLDFSKRWGFPAMTIANLYAYRSTDPAALREVDDPRGPDNLTQVERAVEAAGRVVVGWGTKAPAEAIEPVVAILRRQEVTPYAVARTQEGHPQHPLYVPKTNRPIPWHPPAS